MYKGLLFLLFLYSNFGESLLTLKNKKMDNLVTVKLNNAREVKSRKEVIDEFASNFLKKELSSVMEEGNITKKDQLIFPGYFISRLDLIQILLLKTQ